MWVTDARYLTLHGGMVSLGKEHASLHQDVVGLPHNLKVSGRHANSLMAEVNQALASLISDVAQLKKS